MNPLSRAWQFLKGLVGKGRQAQIKGRDPRPFLSGAAPGLWASNHLAEADQVKGWQFVAIRTMARMAASAETSVHQLVNPARDILELRRHLRVARSIGDTREYRRLYRHYRRLRKMAAPTAQGTRQERRPVPWSDPLLRLLQKPNPVQSGAVWRYQAIQQLAATGSAMLWRVRSKMGLPAELYVIPTGLCIPRMPTEEFPRGSYWITPLSSWGLAPVNQQGWVTGALGSALLTGCEIDARDVRPVRWPHPLYLSDGLSTAAAIALWIDVATQMDMSCWYGLQNSERPGMVFKRDPQVQPSPADLDQFREDLAAEHAGAPNTGKHLILPPGIDADDRGRNPTDMDYARGRPDYRDMVLSGHGVSPVAAGIATAASYAAYWAGVKQTTEVAVQPMLDLLAEDTTQLLGSAFPPGRREVNYKCRAIDDPQLLENRLSTDIAAGNVLLVREYRALRGLPPLGDQRDEQFVGVSVTETPEQREQAGQGAAEETPAGAKLKAADVERLGRKFNRMLLDGWEADIAETDEQKSFRRQVRKCGGPGGKPGPCPEGGAEDQESGVRGQESGDRSQETGDKKPQSGSGSSRVPSSADGSVDHDALHQQAQGKARKLASLLSSIPRKAAAKAAQKVKEVYAKFSQKYGPKWARAIVAAGIIGTLTPVPGATAAAVAPVLMAAKLYTKLAGGSAAKPSGQKQPEREEGDKPASDQGSGTREQHRDAVPGRQDLGGKSRLRKSDFDESKHPRAANGEFGSGSGGGASQSTSDASTSEPETDPDPEEARQEWADYDREHAQYQKDHAAWQEETSRLERHHEENMAAHEQKRAAWEADVARLDGEYKAAHDAWQTRQDARDERENVLSQADPVTDANTPGKTPAIGALEQAAEAWNRAASGRLEEGGVERFTAAARAFGEAQTAAWQAAYGPESNFRKELQALGASEQDLARVDAAAARESKDQERAAAKLNKAADTHATAAAKLAELEKNEPDEPEEPDEPDLLDRPERGDYESDEDYQTDLDDAMESEKAHDQWEKDHTAWEKSQEKYDAYQEKLDAARDREEETAGAVEELASEMETTTWEDSQNLVEEAWQKIKDRLTEQIGKEDEKDEEPAEEPDPDDYPEEPDEPEEPDYPDEPDEPEEPDSERPEAVGKHLTNGRAAHGR